MCMSKIIIREKIYETNSSSSHSFSMGPAGRFTDTLTIDEKGIIEVPSGLWYDKNKTNDPLDKLSYLLTYTYSQNLKWDEDSEDDLITEEGEKILEVIKRAVCDFTGARGVEFDPFHEVDHQSLDMIDPRDLVNPDFIKEFVFNPGTWLYPIWDSFNDGAPGFYEDTEKDEDAVLIHFDLPGIQDPVIRFSFRNLSDQDLEMKIRDFLIAYKYLWDEGLFVPTDDPRKGLSYSYKDKYVFRDLKGHSYTLKAPRIEIP